MCVRGLSLYVSAPLPVSVYLHQEPVACITISQHRTSIIHFIVSCFTLLSVIVLINEYDDDDDNDNDLNNIVVTRYFVTFESSYRPAERGRWLFVARLQERHRSLISIQ